MTEMDYDERNDAINDIVQKFLASVGEFVDACQVHLAYLDPDGNTIAVHYGDGLWHARQGMAKEFLEREQARNHYITKLSEFDEDIDQ